VGAVVDQLRQAAAYIDRILKGGKPSDVPVQRRPNISWWSTWRPPRRSVLTYRRRCLARRANRLQPSIEMRMFECSRPDPRAWPNFDSEMHRFESCRLSQPVRL